MVRIDGNALICIWQKVPRDARRWGACGGAASLALDEDLQTYDLYVKAGQLIMLGPPARDWGRFCAAVYLCVLATLDLDCFPKRPAYSRQTPLARIAIPHYAYGRD